MPNRRPRLSRATVTGLALAVTVAVIASACSAERPTGSSRTLDGDRAIVQGYVLSPSNVGVPKAIVSADDHLHGCSTAAIGHGAASTGGGGMYRVNLPAVAGDSLCIVVTAQYTFGQNTVTVTDSVLVRRNVLVPPLVYDTARLDVQFP